MCPTTSSSRRIVIIRRPPLTKSSAVRRRVSVLALAVRRRLFVFVLITLASLRIRGIGASWFQTSQIMTPVRYFCETFGAAAACGNGAKLGECGVALLAAVGASGIAHKLLGRCYQKILSAGGPKVIYPTRKVAPGKIGCRHMPDLSKTDFAS